MSAKKINLEDEYKKIDNPVISYVKNGAIPHVELIDITREPYITIVPIGDVHLGSKACRESMFREYINFVKETPHTYALFLGDIFDVATLSSPTSPYEQSDSLTEYINMFTDLVTPIKHKVLGVISGNHEDRLRKHANLDILETLSHSIGLPYFKDSLCNIDIRTGIYERKKPRTNVVERITPGTSYKITAHHTVGGGRTLNLNNVDRLRLIVADSDIYIGGHTHKSLMGRAAIMKWSGSAGRSSVNPLDQYLIVVGSFLGYEGYPKRKEMPPAPLSVPIITLSTKRNTKILNVFSDLKSFKEFKRGFNTMGQKTVLLTKQPQPQV